MSKKITKIILLTMIAIFLCSAFYTSMATVLDNFKGDISKASEGAGKIREIMAIVLEIVRTVGAGLAVLIIIVIGCKYIIASAGERADIKKNAVPYVIGVVVLFASSAIAGILKDFATKATTVPTP